MSGPFSSVHLVPDSVIHAQVAAGDVWRDFGIKSWARAKEICPVGDSEGRSGGQLKASLLLRFYFGADGHFEIGSALQTNQVPGGAEPVSLFALIELGTDAHPIDAINSTVLVFRSHGTLVFTPHVDHPGTKANIFAQRATQQILHEMAGLSLVKA